MTNPDGHLEDLLDEALEDFQEGGLSVAASPPRPAAFNPLPDRKVSHGGSSSKGKGKQAAAGLAFNPLSKRGPGRGSGVSSQAATNASKSSDSGSAGTFVGGPSIGNQRGMGAIPPDVMSTFGEEGLAQGLQQLMAELAQVDQANQQGPAAMHANGDGASSSSGNGHADGGSSNAGPRRDRSRDVGATLQALAEQTRSLQADTGPAAGPSGRAQGAGNPMDEDILRQLGAAGLPGLGGLGAEGIPSAETSFADSIMRQLLSKDVLYQPMKDIGARYPRWLAENRSKLSAEAVQRYERQQEYIQKVCHVYDTRPENFAELLDLMHEMQACGQPPPEIVDELAPGLSLGEDGPFGSGPGENASQPPGCPVQ
ncbi:hypothetical protein WJX84_003479 [Apatococcus fuscideae]|uniref:Peroxin-19 n=1 Tax=Apatococcus fuscideae TaxID=2026836 RepID=A0AAW1SP90_9CHLO